MCGIGTPGCRAAPRPTTSTRSGGSGEHPPAWGCAGPHRCRRHTTHKHNRRNNRGVSRGRGQPGKGTNEPNAHGPHRDKHNGQHTHTPRPPQTQAQAHHAQTQQTQQQGHVPGTRAAAEGHQRAQRTAVTHSTLGAPGRARRPPRDPAPTRPHLLKAISHRDTLEDVLRGVWLWRRHIRVLGGLCKSSHETKLVPHGTQTYHASQDPPAKLCCPCSIINGRRRHRHGSCRGLLSRRGRDGRRSRGGHGRTVARGCVMGISFLTLLDNMLTLEARPH